MAELVSPIWDMIKCLCTPVQTYMNYVKSFPENVEELSDKVEDLGERKKYLEQAVNYIHEEEQINEVKRWIKHAIKLENQGKKIEEEAREMKKCKYSVSKQARKAADIIHKHRQVGEFEKLTLPSLTPAVIHESAPSIKGLASVESTLKRVMAAMDGENNIVIGVLGMGGVGKTTIVKNLNNRLEGTQRFSKVIVVVVSKDVDLNQVQDDIASRLGLTFNNNSSRARQLSNRLKREKFLIIFDDVWEKLDLDTVGIPSDDRLKGSKIILTTRKEAVCNEMDTQANIKVDVLWPDEALKLFRSKAGEVVDSVPIHEKAMEVLEECGGLPLAVITVGTALKGKRDLHVWENALKQLRDATPVDIKDMEDKVYKTIRLSYELLREELKPGFLFCCLYPDDYDINIGRMIMQWMGEGILADEGDLDCTINRGHTWVAELKDSCLLLDGRAEGCVRMHDVVRDVGIFIASKHEVYKSVVKTAVGLQRLPRTQWDQYTRISLMRSKIKELQHTASGDHLLTLLLQENKKLQNIDGFLEGRENLRVLDLSNTRILAVSKSASKLGNLRVLCLRSCQFMSWDLSPLGSLKQLEFLDLSHNEKLKELPKVIGELTSLKSLDLNRTPYLASLPQGILPGLTQLEELKMLQSFNDWGAKGKDRSVSTMMASLAEVASLENLSRLFLDCVDENWTPESSWPMHSSYLRNLKKFRIRLIQTKFAENPFPFTDNLSRQSGKCMDIIGHTFLPGDAKVLLEKTAGLTLINCRISSMFLDEKFPTLDYLSIEKCNEMQNVFKEESSAYLDNLRCLELKELQNLREIARGNLYEISPGREERPLGKLTEVQVSQCGRLRYLFRSQLNNLTTVKVEYCGEMMNVFLAPSGVRHGEDSSGMLHNLQTLILSHLPSIINVFPIGKMCSLQNLTTLSVSSCGRLAFVVSYNMLKGGLPNLTELSVVDCVQVMAVIYDVESKDVLLPRLRKLKLESLPRLRSICEKGRGENATADWKSLEEILVRSCPCLKKLEPLRRGPEAVPSLSKIEVEEMWWDGLDWDGNDSISSRFEPLFIHRR